MSAHAWELAGGALDGLDALIARLTPRPDVVVSSEEPKARATAAGLAARLDVPWRTMPGLHEQLRVGAPWRADPADFEADLRQLFEHPQDVVYGEESAADARIRFGNAVDAVLAAHPRGTVAVVAHGTVISVVVAHANHLDPWPLWQELGPLDALTVELPGLRLREPTA